MNTNEGSQMHRLATELFPLCRSLTGNGVRKTIQTLKREIPGLQIHEVESGTKCFDWTVPREWNVEEAYVIGPNGEKVVDFKNHNLHLVGYSVPMDRTMDLAELQRHLYSLPETPDAIPYVTSYYKEHWGFCLPHRVRVNLPEGEYHVVIKSQLSPGSLTYADLLLEGNSSEEVLLSTYVCHPSMANNELSGPVVQTQLAKWLLSLPSRRYSYRFVFVPETIGSIVYLSRHAEKMKTETVAGFNLTCVGDDRCYSYLPSRRGDTLADKAALHVLEHTHRNFVRYTFLDRGSDERQYCSPGIDLPVASIMRSKYREYPEYHTSADDLTLVTPAGLQGAFDALKLAITCLENNFRYRSVFPCEPQLGKRGLYPTVSTRPKAHSVQVMMNMLAYCDGTKSLLEIAETINSPMWDLIPIAEKLVSHGVLERLSA